MSGSEHLEDQRIYDFLDGRLDAAAEGRVQAHLLRCDPCRRRERECAAVVDSLRWYGAEGVEPPVGYWEGFWERWSPEAEPEESMPPVLPVRGLSRALAPALALAAAIALLVGIWWSERPPGTSDALKTASAPPLRQAVAESGWADDYARFERMTVALGGIDPVSKAVALASLAEQP